MGKHGVFDGEGVVRAFVGKVFVGPDLADDFHGLGKQLPVLLVLARVGVGMKLRPFIRPDAPSEPDFDPTPGHVVQDGQVFGQPYRMPPGRDVGHLPDANAARPRRQVRPQQDGIGYVAHPVGTEVMLAQPHRLEAQLLGQNGLLPQVVQVLRRTGSLAGRRRHGGERGKPHFGTSSPFDFLPKRLVIPGQQLW